MGVWNNTAPSWGRCTADARPARPDRPSGRRRYRCGTGCARTSARPRTPAPRRRAARARTRAPRRPDRLPTPGACHLLMSQNSLSVQVSGTRPSAAHAAVTTERRKFRSVLHWFASSLAHWFTHDIVDRGRLPLLCCLVAFILTFFVTRTFVRFIRHRAEAGHPAKWWQPRNLHHRRGAHPPRDVRGDPGDALRADVGDLVRQRTRTRIHLGRNTFRDRRGVGARRVRADPAPVRRVLGRRRPHFGGRGIRRGGGGRTFDHGPAPADVLPADLAGRRIGGAGGPWWRARWC